MALLLLAFLFASTTCGLSFSNAHTPERRLTDEISGTGEVQSDLRRLQDVTDSTGQPLLFGNVKLELNKWTTVPMGGAMPSDNYAIILSPPTVTNERNSNEFVTTEVEPVSTTEFRARLRKPLTASECPKQTYHDEHPLELVYWMTMPVGTFEDDYGLWYQVDVRNVTHDSLSDKTVISPTGVPKDTLIKGRLITAGRTYQFETGSEVEAPQEESEFPIFDAGCCYTQGGGYSVRTHVSSFTTDFRTSITTTVHSVFLSSEDIMIDGNRLVVRSLEAREESNDDVTQVTWDGVDPHGGKTMAVVGGTPYITGYSDMVVPRLRSVGTASDPKLWTIDISHFLEDCYVAAPGVAKDLEDVYRSPTSSTARKSHPTPVLRRDAAKNDNPTNIKRRGVAQYAAILGRGDFGVQRGESSRFFRNGCDMVGSEWKTIHLHKPMTAPNGPLAVTFSPMSTNGNEFGTPVYEAFNETSFRVKIMKPLGKPSCSKNIYDSQHPLERVCWAAFAPGLHKTEEGTDIEVVKRNVTASETEFIYSNDSDGEQRVYFPRVFISQGPPPVVTPHTFILYNIATLGTVSFVLDSWSTPGDTTPGKEEDFQVEVTFVGFHNPVSEEMWKFHISKTVVLLPERFAVEGQSDDDAVDVPVTVDDDGAAQAHAGDVVAVVGGGYVIARPPFVPRWRQLVPNGSMFDTNVDLESQLVHGSGHIKMSAFRDDCEMPDIAGGLSKSSRVSLMAMFREPIDQA